MIEISNDILEILSEIQEGLSFRIHIEMNAHLKASQCLFMIVCVCV